MLLQSSLEENERLVKIVLGEFAFGVKDISNAARHSGCKVTSSCSQNQYSASSHVLTSMVSHSLWKNFSFERHTLYTSSQLHNDLGLGCGSGLHALAIVLSIFPFYSLLMLQTVFPSWSYTRADQNAYLNYCYGSRIADTEPLSCHTSEECLP